MKKSFYCFCTVCMFFLLSILNMSCSHNVQEQTKNDGTIIIKNNTDKPVYVHYSAVNERAVGINALLSTQITESENVLINSGEKAEFIFSMKRFSGETIYRPALFVSPDNNKWYWEIYDAEFLFQLTVTIIIENNDELNKPYKQSIIFDEYDGYENPHKEKQPDGIIKITNESTLDFFVGLQNFDSYYNQTAISKRVKVQGGETKEIEYYLEDLSKFENIKTVMSVFCPLNLIKTDYYELDVKKMPQKLTISITSEGINTKFE
ncbi:MAG: hypothetical protein J5527_03135 [Treponema sp.]|nr:hypothetical protein [Treponema sp.]